LESWWAFEGGASGEEQPDEEEVEEESEL